MTLQTSGAISFADIETEFSDHSSPGFDLDSYYGLARGIPTSGALKFDDFYGENGSADISVGIWNLAGFGYNAYGYATGTAGSITDGVFNKYNSGTLVDGCLVHSCYWYSFDSKVYFKIPINAFNQTADADTTFKNLMIESTPFLRSAATHTTGTEAIWSWSAGTNPFGTIADDTKQIAMRVI